MNGFISSSTLMSYEHYMRTLWPKSMKIWWFNRALCRFIQLSILRDLSLLKDSNTLESFIVFRISVLSLLKDSDSIGIFYCFCNFGTILIIIIIIIILFSGRTRSESQISKTASHSATKLNSYMDPYPTMCSARFGVDPDYRSGSRAKSGFSDFPHYLRNLPSDLQMQYL